MGLSEEEAEIAAEGRRGPSLKLEPQNVDAKEADLREVREATDKFVSDDAEKMLEESFLRMGLSESGAKIAAKGR